MRDASGRPGASRVVWGASGTGLPGRETGLGERVEDIEWVCSQIPPREDHEPVIDRVDLEQSDRAGDATELGDPNLPDLIAANSPGLPPTGNRETVLVHCQFGAGPPRQCCEREQSHASYAGKNTSGRVCDHGHSCDSQRDSDYGATCDSSGRWVPVSLLHGFFTPSYRD